MHGARGFVALGAIVVGCGQAGSTSSSDAGVPETFVMHDVSVPDVGSADQATDASSTGDAAADGPSLACEGGTACPPGCGGVCCDGRCLVPLASGLTAHPSAIAVDATYVYWTNLGESDGTPDGVKPRTGLVMRTPIGGGAVVTLAETQDQPDAIAVDATSVYWTNQGAHGPLVATGTVMRVPIAGGPLVTLASAQSAPAAIAVDAANVYFTNQAEDVTNNKGSVVKVPLAGGTPTTLATDASQLAGIAVDATHVYWGACGGALLGVPIAGGAPRVVALDPQKGCVQSVGVDSANVYWLAHDGALKTQYAYVYATPPSGGTTVTLYHDSALPSSTALALAPGATATDVYAFASNYVGGGGLLQGLVRIATSGSTSTLLAPGLDQEALAIAVDTTSVYWAAPTTTRVHPDGTTTTLGGAIMKLTPR